MQDSTRGEPDLPYDEQQKFFHFIPHKELKKLYGSEDGTVHSGQGRKEPACLENLKASGNTGS